MRGNSITDRNGEKNPNYKHGLRNTKLFRIWSNMKNRCTNPNCEHFDRYGGRGITICDEWQKNFIAFYEWSISNGYSDNLTLDRKNNDKGYSPDNCRWVTSKTQANNTSRCKFITIDGERKTMREWCDITGVNYNTARDRINRGHWDPVEAVTTPSNLKFRKKVMPC